MSKSDFWYRDKETLLAEREKHLTFGEMSAANGGNPHPRILQEWWKRLGLPKQQAGPRRAPIPADAPISEVELLRKRNRELERHAKRVRTGAIEAESLVESIRDAAQAVNPRYKPRAKLHSSGKKDEGDEAALLFSDTHASEVVRAESTMGMNSYDWDIMLARMARLQDVTLRHLEHYASPVKRLHVWLLGDMLSGDIHEELTVTNDRPAAEAAVDFGHELARFVEEFVPHFERVSVAGVPGNHPRRTQKPQAKDPHNNADWIAYKIAESLLSKYPSVDWNLPRASYATVSVAERWRVLLMHGDGIRSSMPGVPWGGVVRRVTVLEQQFAQAKQPIDYICMGHFHSANALDGVGVQTFMNGSVKGLDEFSLKTFGSGRRPTQRLITFHPKYGVTGVRYIDLEDASPAGEKAA